ncbi:unnamed protein product [Closterium sp. NIES-65]|nr:unnamed protein product [Closterium sp. NIES-65]
MSQAPSIEVCLLCLRTFLSPALLSPSFSSPEAFLLSLLSNGPSCHVTQPHSLPLFPPLFPLSLPPFLSSLSRFPPSLPSLPPFLSSLSRFPPSLPSLFPLSLPSLSSLSPSLSLFPLSLPSLSSLSPSLPSLSLSFSLPSLASLPLFPLSLPFSLPSLASLPLFPLSLASLSLFPLSLASLPLFPLSLLQAMLYAVGLGKGAIPAAAAVNWAMLYAVGLGKGAIPAAAAVNWVLKDGLGYAAKVTLSQFGRHFDVSPKRSRLLSDLVENLSASLELLTATFPQYFVQLAAAAGAGFSASSLVQSATRNRFYAGLAGRRNFAEVLARAEAQGMVSKTLGMALGIVVAPHVGTRGPLLWATHGLLSAAHLFCNYRSYKAVQLRTLNPFRADIVLAEYVTNGRVPGVIEASPPPLPGTGSENWIEFGVPLASRQQWLTQTDVSTLPYSHSTRTPSPPPLSRPLPLLVQAQAASPPPLPGTGSENWIEFGVPLAAVAHTEREAETMADIFRGEKYLLGRDERTGQMQWEEAEAVAGMGYAEERSTSFDRTSVVLKEGAVPRDFLRAALQAAYLRTLSPHVLCPTIHSLAPQARTHVQARAPPSFPPWEADQGAACSPLPLTSIPSPLIPMPSHPATTIHAGSVEGGGTPRDFLRAALQAAYLRTLSPHVLCPTIHSLAPQARTHVQARAAEFASLGKLEVLHASYDRMAAGFDGLCEALRANGWRCDDGLLARPGDWRLLLAPEEKRK